MNLYFFLEGKRTEPKVYRAWLAQVFPHLNEVSVISEVKADSYLLISGFGYPQLLNRIDEVVADIERHGGIDYLFVCLDSEGDKPEDRIREIENRVGGKLTAAVCHTIIHNCCIETWFLGNKQVMKRNPESEKLRTFKTFYDVSVSCPELMVCPPGYRIRAHFHLDYLKEMLRERGLSYSKEHPREVQKKSYLAALVRRHEKTGHLQSFGRLVAVWRALNGNI
ncbi:MAG: hypothetical protein ACREBD_27545 [Blastocatellia bacterium]